VGVLGWKKDKRVGREVGPQDPPFYMLLRRLSPEVKGGKSGDCEAKQRLDLEFARKTDKQSQKGRNQGGIGKTGAGETTKVSLQEEGQKSNGERIVDKNQRGRKSSLPWQ